MVGNPLVVQRLGRRAFTVEGLHLIPGWETKILQAVKHSSLRNPEDVDDTDNGILLNYSVTKKNEILLFATTRTDPKISY